MTRNELEKQYNEIRIRQDKALQKTEEARRKHTEDLIALEIAKNLLERTTSSLYMHYANTLTDEEKIDPRTGRASEPWATAVVQAKLRNDEEYIVANENIEKCKQDEVRSQTDVLVYSEELGTTNHQSRMLAAAMTLETGG